MIWLMVLIYDGGERHSRTGYITVKEHVTEAIHITIDWEADSAAGTLG